MKKVNKRNIDSREDRIFFLQNAHVILEWGTICEKHLNVSYTVYFKSAIFCMLTESLLVNQATFLLTKHGNKQEILVGMGIFPHKSLFSGNHIG
jgi:hypothetical protein